jgi:MFS family permease
MSEDPGYSADLASELVASADSLPASVPPSAAASAEPWPRPAQAWYAVSVFALSLLVNMLDRGILTLLVQPIKRDLHLSDFQMGLLMGFAFVLFYLLLGLPIARLVDSKSRRTIIAIGISIWSFMTAACGLARNFLQLFLCRVAVGSGESCTGPATFSMLADLFPREKLPRAIAVLNFGFYAGNGLALMIGGTLTQIFASLPPTTLPVLGTIRGWQLTFFAVGLPGLMVAALMGTVPEPKRRGVAPQNLNGARLKPLPIREVVRYMSDHASTYVPMFVGMGVQAVMMFGIGSWGPAFYIRTFHWTPAKFGFVQGLIALTVMPLGAFVGSLIAEHFAKKGHDDANMRAVLWASILPVPGYILFPLMPNAFLAVSISIYSLFVASWVGGPINAALQSITPNQMRGQVTALFLLVFNVVGYGLGPTIVAMFTDMVFHSEAQIGRSLAATVAILAPIGILMMALARKPYGRSIAQARAWS